jgi:hypothetical protein
MTKERDWILTLGSSRQSSEFSEAIAYDHDWSVCHIVEELAPWTAKESSQLLREAYVALREMGVPPKALVNLGRATVPYGIDAIAACCETLKASSPDLADVAVIGPSFSAARTFSDKWLIYESLTKIGLVLPVTRRISPETINLIEQDLSSGAFPLPAVVKVTDLTGGCGMEFIGESRDLDRTVERLSGLNHPLIITEFVCGDEISFDVLRLGKECLVYPPGLKACTDTNLTHADHKIKINGYLSGMESLEREIVCIVEHFDLQGFFSIEGVITGSDPLSWKILEGATRVTNNYQMQSASLRFDGFRAVSRYLRGHPWLPVPPRVLSLALSIPIYTHQGKDSLALISGEPWVLQAKIENLAEMPLSRDTRSRMTVKMAADQDLTRRLGLLEKATGDKLITDRVTKELQRLDRAYPQYQGGKREQE